MYNRVVTSSSANRVPSSASRRLWERSIVKRYFLVLLLDRGSRTWRHAVVAARAEKIKRPKRQTERQDADAARIINGAGRDEAFDQSGDHQHHHAAQLDRQRGNADLF